MKKIIYTIALLLIAVCTYGQQEKELTLNEDTGLIEAVYFHDNGVISQKGTFNLDRKLHGEWISYNEQGEKITQGMYEMGLRTGTWTFWNGDAVKIVEYTNNAVASIDGKKSSARVAKN